MEERTEVVLRLVEAMLGNPRYDNKLEREIIDRAKEMADQILENSPRQSESPEIPQSVQSIQAKIELLAEKLSNDPRLTVLKPFSAHIFSSSGELQSALRFPPDQPR